MIDDPARLAIAYAVAVDRRDTAALAELFAPDARVHLPAGMTGRDAPATNIAPAELLGPLRRWARTRHVVMQQLITVTAGCSRATGECYGEAHHVSVDDGAAHDLILHLRYLDEFVRTDAGWLFAARALVVDWSGRQPVRLWG